MRFAFRIGNHFGFSDGADDDLQGYDTNFGALIDERYPFASSGCRTQRPHGDTSVGSFPTTGEGWKLMRQQSCRSFHQGEAVLHRLLHLLEGTHAYLAHALARDAELVGELLERDRFFGEPARLEDPPLSVVEHGERRGEGLAAAAELLACGECRLLVGMLVDQPVVPLAAELPCASGDELVSLGFRVGNPSAIGWHQRRIFQHPSYP